MLSLKNVCKTFNKGTINEKKAIDGLDLHLAPGDFATVIGGNGAGKSTMLNLISGTYQADSGSILLDGVAMERLPEHLRAAFLGRVFQDPMMGTAAEMGIEENLAMAHRRGKRRGFSWGITAAEREEYRERLAQLGLGLEDRMKSPVGLLSGGQRQALTLLMATLVTPKLLLLDEHTAALDPATAEKVLELTKKTVEEGGITCMMITHNISQALSLGTRTVMMDGGRIVLDLSGEERAGMTVPRLLELFRERAAHDLDNDRMLLER